MKLRKTIVYALLANLIFLTLAPTIISAESSDWWDETWSFRQDVFIPIDTSSEYSKFQPIDVRVEFKMSILSG